MLRQKCISRISHPFVTSPTSLCQKLYICVMAWYVSVRDERTEESGSRYSNGEATEADSWKLQQFLHLGGFYGFSRIARPSLKKGNPLWAT